MLINNLNSLDFIEANKILNTTISSGYNFSINEIEDLLNLNEKEITATFLEKYETFEEHQLSFIEGYINKNIAIANKDYLSDLIDFATYWSLNLNYKKLLILLSNDHPENKFVVLSTVQYITENIKLMYIEEIVMALENILNNPNFYQNTQIASALALYRLTHKKSYLEEIKHWFKKTDEVNILYLKNTLKLKFNKDMFFDNTAIKDIILSNVEE